MSTHKDNEVHLAEVIVDLPHVCGAGIAAGIYALSTVFYITFDERKFLRDLYQAEYV